MRKQPTAEELAELRSITKKMLELMLPAAAAFVQATREHGAGRKADIALEKAAEAFVDAMEQANREGLLDR